MQPGGEKRFRYVSVIFTCFEADHIPRMSRTCCELSSSAVRLIHQVDVDLKCSSDAPCGYSPAKSDKKVLQLSLIALYCRDVV